MKQPEVTVTDRHRLKTTIFHLIAWVERDQLHWIDMLDWKLDTAHIIFNPEETPRDLVTMRSRIRLRNLSGSIEDGVYSLIYPIEDERFPNPLSAVSPLGLGVLGERAGAEVKLPDGSGKVEIAAVVYQPEADGHHYS